MFHVLPLSVSSPTYSWASSTSNSHIASQQGFLLRSAIFSTLMDEYAVSVCVPTAVSWPATITYIPTKTEVKEILRGHLSLSIVFVYIGRG